LESHRLISSSDKPDQTKPRICGIAGRDLDCSGGNKYTSKANAAAEFHGPALALQEFDGQGRHGVTLQFCFGQGQAGAVPRRAVLKGRSKAVGQIFEWSSFSQQPTFNFLEIQPYRE